MALSDDSANITDTYTYDPFGTMLTHTGTTKQPFTFLGEYGVQQEDTSLYFIRARYYDAANGRFLSKDPFPVSLINPQTLNRYIYGGDSPINNYDFSGLNFEFPEEFDFSNSIIAGNNYLKGRGEYSDYLLALANDVHKFLTIFPGYGTGVAFENYKMNPTPENYQEFLISLGMEFIPGIGHVLVDGLVNTYLGHLIKYYNIPQNILNGYLSGINWLGDQIGGGLYDLFNTPNQNANGGCGGY